MILRAVGLPYFLARHRSSQLSQCPGRRPIVLNTIMKRFGSINRELRVPTRTPETNFARASMTDVVGNPLTVSSRGDRARSAGNLWNSVR